MVTLQGVTKRFVTGHNDILIVDDVWQSFEKGKTYALIGASGTGKSTLLHMLAGFEPSTCGSICWPMIEFSASKKNNPGVHESFLSSAVGIVFQQPCLVPEFSIIENVALKGLITGMAWAECVDRAMILLHKVGLADFSYQPILTLSGGQQQRVALARALFIQPEFLLLDEVTAHVDQETTHDLIKVLLDYKKEGVSSIVITHDITVAQKMDYIFKLEQGKLHPCQLSEYQNLN